MTACRTIGVGVFPLTRSNATHRDGIDECCGATVVNSDHVPWPSPLSNDRRNIEVSIALVFIKDYIMARSQVRQGATDWNLPWECWSRLPTFGYSLLFGSPLWTWLGENLSLCWFARSQATGCLISAPGHSSSPSEFMFLYFDLFPLTWRFEGACCSEVFARERFPAPRMSHQLYRAQIWQEIPKLTSTSSWAMAPQSSITHTVLTMFKHQKRVACSFIDVHH